MLGGQGEKNKTLGGTRERRLQLRGTWKYFRKPQLTPRKALKRGCSNLGAHPPPQKNGGPPSPKNPREAQQLGPRSQEDFSI